MKENHDSEEFLKKDNDESIKPERITCLSFKKTPALKISKWSDDDTNKFYKVFTYFLNVDQFIYVRDYKDMALISL